MSTCVIAMIEYQKKKKQSTTMNAIFAVQKFCCFEKK